MRLTSHTDFALRLLMSLAVMEERLVTITVKGPVRSRSPIAT